MADAGVGPGVGPEVGDRTSRQVLAGQGVRFLVIGVGSFVVDVGLFNLLAHGPGGGALHDHALTARIVSTLVSALVSYYGNKLWTFADHSTQEPVRRWVMFVLVNIVAWSITLLPLVISRDLLGLSSALADNVSSNVIGLTVAIVFRFYAYRRWVFS